MKTTLAILALILVLTSLSACGDTQEKTLMSRQEAISLALDAADHTQETGYGLEAELDREWGTPIWEVDFETREYEYTYHIHAETGKTLRTERERN